MSRESIKNTIERVKADLAKERDQIAYLRSRNSADSASYADRIKNSRDANAKANYRDQKARSAASYDRQIDLHKNTVERLQRQIADLRAELARTK